MNALSRYRHILASKGVSLTSVGLEDVGLRSPDALEAVQVLRQLVVPILGGDVFVKRSGAIELAYANWHADRQSGEGLREFVERSCLGAEHYIAAFPPKEGEEPLFVLVIPTGSLNPE